MSTKAKVVSLCSQNGGVGKTTSAENLGVGLALEGKKVLLVDNDPQASLTVSLGWPEPERLPAALPDLMQQAIDGQGRETDLFGGIKSRGNVIPDGRFGDIVSGAVLHHPEGVDLIPADISLAGMEVSLVNTISRETVLKQCLREVEKQYDFILIDGAPSLGLLTINMLSTADSVIIPVQPQYLSVKGMEQLLQTISRVKRNINPKLKIDGILLTMVDGRTNYAKEIEGLIRETYGSRIRVYDTKIPRSVRAEEISAEGKSIFQHDPKGKVAEAYRSLTGEVLAMEERRRSRKQEMCL